MGFPMALNLRAKMPPTSKLVVCDVNKAHVEDFLVQSLSLGPVEVASSPKEVAKCCVSIGWGIFQIAAQLHIWSTACSDSINPGCHNHVVTSRETNLPSVH